MKKLIDFESEFEDKSNIYIVDATKLFELKSPYVIHPGLDTHLSAEGNKKLADFIYSRLQEELKW